MAHHKATIKSIRQIATRTKQNLLHKSRTRTFLKRVEAAINKKDKKLAQTALKEAESQIMHAVTKGVFKKNTASRKISRLSAKVKALKA